MTWEIVVGLETHVQLSTRSKIFSGASTAFGAAPNTHACAVDLALPGVLPVLNREAVAKAVRFGLAVGGTINRRSVFARKNYFYPDLPKGYQISQYELPIVAGGSLSFMLDGAEKTVQLTRAHLEEDAGKSLHEEFADYSGIDLNRAGTPLVEIVTEPDMRGAAEAVAYAKALHALVRWLDISDGNMQEGSFRCDANVSVRPVGTTAFGTRCEIKNLNSFRFIERAILFEVQRQIELLEDGGRVVQETRLYDPARDETRPMRSKEDAHDYRYFPDPDLPPLEVPRSWLEEIRGTLPELPRAKRERFTAQYGLTPYDAALLTASRELADYYEQTLAVKPDNATAVAKQVANWVSGALSAKLNDENLDIGACRVSPSQLRGLVERIADGTISGKIAKDVFEAMWTGEGDADSIIAAKGLKQISDSGELEKIVDGILAANPAQVAEFKAGKEKAFNFFVGQAMKATKGKANPAQLSEIIRRRLGEG
ncbi:MAG TPA: Asp-tRNA(Asn)/Glu-tRNA(Gln) amidotransferase subunit GatB [Burkholderiales bacterium]|nr:Asp-tRNA(Asn)/Glu-tRNA(Gln) amidotransferase subunit GatB [Burkholderiales bacterium]